jgi:hypothetical protein
MAGAGIASASDARPSIRALRSFAPGLEPVLWPEHFDLGIKLDEVNFGVSPRRPR